MVPRAAFAWVTRRMKGAVEIPLITTNRINDPATAEAVLARGDADMVSMARPFLADADFVNKAAENRADEINTCIGCNQACLDQIFARKIASCLVNPFACRETEWKLHAGGTAQERRRRRRGAGRAGGAPTAAERGHHVTLFDAAAEIGGQFNLARRIPGKEEFAETLRYLPHAPCAAGRRVGSNRRADRGRPARLRRRHRWRPASFRAFRDIPGIDHPKVASYVEIVDGAGRRAAAWRSSARAASASTWANSSPPATRRRMAT